MASILGSSPATDQQDETADVAPPERGGRRRRILPLLLAAGAIITVALRRRRRRRTSTTGGETARTEAQTTIEEPTGATTETGSGRSRLAVVTAALTVAAVVAYVVRR